MELPTQELAERYRNTSKRLKDKKKLRLVGKFKVTETLVSDEFGDIFKLDIRRQRIELKMLNCNSRADESWILARLDVNDREHKNPDRTTAPETHLHIYQEGYNGRFAYDPKKFGFKDFNNIPSLIRQFLKFCNIDKSEVVIEEAANDHRFEGNK